MSTIKEMGQKVMILAIGVGLLELLESGWIKLLVFIGLLVGFHAWEFGKDVMPQGKSEVG